VNAVSPGSIDTPGLSDLLASSETGEQRKKMISTMVPLGRFGKPDEIGKAVVFSHPTTAATSPERNCLWTAVSHKRRPARQGLAQEVNGPRFASANLATDQLTDGRRTLERRTLPDKIA